MLAFVHRILKVAGPYAPRIRLSFLFSFLKQLCANMPIMLAIFAIMMLLEGTATVSIAIVFAAIGFATMMLQTLFQYIVDKLQSASGYELFADMRLTLGDHLRRLPMGYFTAGNIGKISSILSVDMVFIEENSMTILADAVSDVFSQAILIVFMLILSPPLGLAIIAIEAVAVCIGTIMTKRITYNSDVRQQSLEDMTQAVIEYTAGFGIIKSFNLAGEGAKELRRSFAQMTDQNLEFEGRYTPYHRAILIVFALGTAIVLLLSAHMCIEGTLPIPYFTGIALFLFLIFQPSKHVYQLGARLSIMNSALDRIDALMNESELPDDGESPLPAAESTIPEIAFEGVEFGYGEARVLDDVTFSMPRGSMTALVGPSGSGKSTIANVLTRFWDIQAGRILVRGVDVREMPLSTLMENVTMVFQCVYLFNDTVFNNIALGHEDATYEQVVEVAKKARCYDFIMDLPYGFDTIIGEGGASLSGGEAQRISIARSLLKDAPIVILDEATASVDADNESAIQSAISTLCRGKTTLVIAHRLKTIVDADQILMIDAGQIVEQGTHADLLAAGGRYAAMVAAQQHAGGLLEGEAS
ncbi:ABC transporter ATP-binding protein [Curtanaerobium respiraculi]|uniref:ABC transporter ATP-binding protein n=1 Tax=Curtanaerobium respiraculi TaxID=2949669 RepID=UPI0024B38343|nr:ABC transporter ATP-binding protein [Curtanaerobium respiraculi]